MMMNQLFKLTLTHQPLLMITKLVSDSIINSCSDYQQELKILFQEKIGSELLDLPKLEIMVQVKPPEIEDYLSSKHHGILMVWFVSSLLMI